MANFTTYPNGEVIAAAAGGNAASLPAVDMLVGVFDAARQNLAAGDTVDLINVPAGTFVQKVFAHVLNGDATQTLNVGDATDRDGYVAAADVATTGTRAMGAGAYATGKFYATADKITLEVPATKALDTLKVRVVAFVAAIG